MSGVAIAALVLAAVAASIVITMLILNSKQSATEDQLAQERARAANAEQTPAAQPPVIVMPPSQPATAPVVTPPPSQPAPNPTATAPTSTELEINVTSKMLDDAELRSSFIDVKVSGSTATLSGRVPSQELKTRAERLAKTVKGVSSVINDIVVKAD